MMSFDQLHMFYNQISLSYRAGISLVTFFDDLYKMEKSENQKLKFLRIAQNLKNGQSLASILKKTNLVPIYDLPIIESAEKSGHIEDAFSSLAQNYSLKHAAQKDIKTKLQYPFIMFCFALIIPGAPDLLLGKITLAQYGSRIGIILTLVLITTYWIFNFFLKSHYDINLARKKQHYLKKIPFLAHYALNTALERYLTSLKMMLESGISMYDSFNMASQASADETIIQATKRIIDNLKAGQNLSEVILHEPLFLDFQMQKNISLGHTSGKLPEFIQQSLNLLIKNNNESLVFIAQVISKTIHTLAILYAAYTILNLYLGNLSAISKFL